MAAVDEHLVRRANDVVLLLTPPFDGTSLESGSRGRRPEEWASVLSR
jgi:hypothetical protein